MVAVSPFLARHRESGATVVVLGFSDGGSPQAICAGVGMRLVPLDELDVIRAAVDWPRPNDDSEEVDAIFGPRTKRQPRAEPPRPELHIS
jgi:hypothetical protein